MNDKIRAEAGRRYPRLDGAQSAFIAGAEWAEAQHRAADARNTAAWRRRKFASGQLDHGKSGTYDVGCRCPECTEAKRVAIADYRARVRAAREEVRP